MDNIQNVNNCNIQNILLKLSAQNSWNSNNKSRKIVTKKNEEQRNHKLSEVSYQEKRSVNFQWYLKIATLLCGTMHLWNYSDMVMNHKRDIVSNNTSWK
jgi:hypothetical protein